MNICVAANSKYVRYLYVMLTSLFMNNEGEEFMLYILQCDFTAEDKDLIRKLCGEHKQKAQFIQINSKEFECLPTTYRYSLETYFRFKIIEQIPETEDRILYLDVDLIVRGSVRELYSIDMGTNYFAACTCMMQPQLVEQKQHIFNRYDDLRYFNAGVMLWNLKELRGKVCFKDFIQGGYDLNFNLPSVDQEILNYLFYDKTLYLNPYKYNYLVFRDLRKMSDEKEQKMAMDSTPIIYHYCWFNPWQVGPKTEKYYEWWKYAKLTPFYQDFLWEQLWRTEESMMEKWKEQQEPLNAARIVSIVYDSLYQLKGTGKIAEYLKGSSMDYYLYGVGRMAQSFYDFLVWEGREQIIKGVFDKYKKGSFYGIPVNNDVERGINKIKGPATIIVTPSLKKEEIVEELEGYLEVNIKIILLPVFLDNILKGAY